jgi:hypothetical protein
LRFFTGSTAGSSTGTERLRIDSSGRVGIGTSSPNQALEVVGTQWLRGAYSANTALAFVGNSGVGRDFAITRSADATMSLEMSGRNAFNIVGNTGNTDCFFTFSGTGTTEHMRLDSSGRVGIGTSSPSAPLHVKYADATTTGLVNGLKLQQGNGTNGNRLSLVFSTLDNFTVAGVNGVIETHAGQEVNNVGRLEFYTKASGGSVTERMRIDSSGNVDIGSVISSGYVSGALIQSGGKIASYVSNSTAGSDQRIYVYNGSTATYKASINADGSATFAGNVGIGTTTPSVLLHVAATEPQFFIQDLNGTGNGVNATIQFRDSSNSQLSYLGFAAPSDSHLSLFNTMSGGDLRFGTASIERMRIDTSGRLLIGTSSSRTGGLLQVETTGSGSSRIHNLVNNANDSTSPILKFTKTRGTTVGAVTAVQNDDALGYISFSGTDGTNVVDGAYISALVDGTPGTNDLPTRLAFFTTADGASSPTERMRITSNGNVLVGSTTPTISGLYPLQVVGDRGLVAKSTGGGANPSITTWNNESTNDATFIEFRTDTVDVNRGSITYDRSAGLVSYNTTSDYRAKTLHENLQNASATVNLLNVYRGTMHGATESRPMMVAHEVQEIAPYCVTGEKDAVDGNGDPIYQSIDHSPLVPLLTAALQEALAKIEALEQRLADAGL